MSKVISFSISDRYLDKIRSLYPALTDNLAVKKFLTDRLDSSLGNSLDDSLDGILDDKVKTLIETWVDGLLEVRLDDAVGKFLSQVTERLSRLESRLDDRLDGRLYDGLDDMEYLLVEHLLKRERESSIASPIPTIEETVETADNVETDSLFKLALKLDHLDDQALIDVIESQLQDDDNEENYSTVETSPPDKLGEDEGAIETLTGDTSPINEPEPAIEKTQAEIARLLGVHSSTVTRWKQNKAIPSEYSDKCRFNHDKTKILWIYDRI